MKTLVLAIALLFCALPAFAQTPVTPGSAQKFGWDHSAASQAEEDAQGVNVYVDALPAAPLAGKVCTSPSAGNFACTAPIPALTPGVHAVAITATLNGSESAKSNTLSLVMVIMVAPGNFRIVRLLDLVPGMHG